jgi:hypothetical protein
VREAGDHLLVLRIWGDLPGWGQDLVFGCRERRERFASFWRIFLFPGGSGGVSCR